MRDDEIAGQSLIFAQQETAHREHLHLHQHQHQHQHNKIHKRQTASGSVVTEVVAEVIAEVIATVAVVQQIDVNSNGSTIATQTVLADSTADSVPAAVTDSSSPTTTTAASLLIANPGSAASSTVVGPAQPDSFAEPSLSLLSSQSAVSVPTSTLSIPTSFASLIVSSNSTTCKFNRWREIGVL
jgi:hypothetical protein